MSNYSFIVNENILLKFDNEFWRLVREKKLLWKIRRSRRIIKMW